MPTHVEKRWESGRIAAISYDAVVERERLARLFGALMWSSDTRRLFGEIERLGELPDGTSVLDIPCGGGLAFRALRVDQALRYVAADLSPVMLERAARRAEQRRLKQVEFVQANVERLPFEEASFDHAVTYNGLHCFPNPEAALVELGRVLRPGGELRGTAVIAGTGRRHDALIRLNQRGGTFGRVGDRRALQGWLEAAGLSEIQLEPHGALAHFSGRRSE